MSDVQRLLDVMRRLRDPRTGCPWDVQQDFRSIAPYTIEEAHEVADVIERDALDELPGELGDLLLQVVFHAQMAAEEDRFDFGDVVDAIVEKMVRRHPHVFADQQVADAEAQTVAWEEHKHAERMARSGAAPDSALDDVARGLPAMYRAAKLQKRAARVGFDWPDAAAVMPKLHEETAELEHEVRVGGSSERLEHELGDLLFTCVNLARHLGVEPESALRAANGRFERRFRHMEALLRETGQQMESMQPGQLEQLWQRAKRELQR